MKSTVKKVGRPASGKKAFCVRMSPTAYAVLVEGSKSKGYASLGAWLESLASRDEKEAKPIDSMSPMEIADAFYSKSLDASAALTALYEIVDHVPAETKLGTDAFASLNNQYRKLMQLAINVGVVRGGEGAAQVRK